MIFKRWPLNKGFYSRVHLYDDLTISTFRFHFHCFQLPNCNICYLTNIYILFKCKFKLDVYIPQAKATLVCQVLIAFCYCFIVETSGWHYIETLKPPSLLWGWLVYHTRPSTHNLIKCQIPYVWPPPHHYTKWLHYHPTITTIDITD